jgi:hypothetical protein
VNTAAVPYDAKRAHDLAIVVATVVPVLLVAAFAIPVKRVRSAAEAKSALVELVAAAILLASALVTEMLSLFGIAYGLGHTDQSFLFLLLFATALAALRRMIAPFVHTYSEDRGVPAERMWWLLAIVTLVLSLGMIFLLAYAENH